MEQHSNSPATRWTHLYLEQVILRGCHDRDALILHDNNVGNYHELYYMNLTRVKDIFVDLFRVYLVRFNNCVSRLPTDDEHLGCVQAKDDG